MSEDKRRFKTVIAGRPYTILANKPEEHLKTVAEMTNDKITQIKGAMPELDIEQRSVLVAVNAISDSISKQAEINTLKERLSELEKGKPTPSKTVSTKVTTQSAQVLEAHKKPVNTKSRTTVKQRLNSQAKQIPGMPRTSKEKLLNRSSEMGKR